MCIMVQKCGKTHHFKKTIFTNILSVFFFFRISSLRTESEQTTNLNYWWKIKRQIFLRKHKNYDLKFHSRDKNTWPHSICPVKVDRVKCRGGAERLQQKKKSERWSRQLHWKNSDIPVSLRRMEAAGFALHLCQSLHSNRETVKRMRRRCMWDSD